MKISHVAMYVSDLERTKEFYKKYFGAVANDKYMNANTGLQTYFLSFDNDVRLEIMARPNCIEAEQSLIRIGFIHLAFSVGGKAEVDRLTELLEKDGYKVISQPRTTGDGYYESCVLDIEGNQIEIIG